MMEKGLLIQIDSHLPIPINVQIKEQIKWLIGIGVIKPGEYLPPTNQLAENLRLNRNTINWVYTQLRDEGIVKLQKGKGTQVTDGAKIQELKARRKILLAFVEKMVKESRNQGFDMEEVFLSSIAYSQLFNTQINQKLRILFIECREHDHNFYRSEIERLTQAEVTSLFLEDIQYVDDTDQKIKQSDYVITTLNHAEEVKRLLVDKDIKLLTIGATPEMSLLLEIARLEPGSKVGFICLGNKGGQWMAQRVKDAGITQIESIPQGADQIENLLRTMESSDLIYASPVVYKEIKELAPNKAVLYPLKLEQSSETLLKELTEN